MTLTTVIVSGAVCDGINAKGKKKEFVLLQRKQIAGSPNT